MKIEEIEKRFKYITNINVDLSIYPIKDKIDFAIDKVKCKKYAEVFTPINIIDAMIDIIPNLNPNVSCIDLCAGYGHFTVRLLRRLYNNFNNFDIDNYLSTHLFCELQLSSCFKILHIFGGCINLAIGNVFKLADLPYNAKGVWMHNGSNWIDINHVVVDLNYNYTIDNQDAFVNTIEGIYIGKDLDYFKSATVGIEGKYDVVLSNPPYQKNNGGGNGSSASPIYNKIMEYTIDYLKTEFICMITPSRWMAGGVGLDNYRERMLNDKRMELIVDFPSEKEIFKNVKIMGGVSYFLWNKNYNGLCKYNGALRELNKYDIFVRDNMATVILEKIINKSIKLNNSVKSTNYFGVRSNFSDWDKNDNSLECYCQKNTINYTSKYKDPENILGKYKVCTGKTNDISFNKYYTLFVLEPNQICIETYLVVNTFDTKKEADNYKKYMETKLYRFMLSLRLIGISISKKTFSWVPDFEDYNHIYTDADLYKHFELTKKEIEHIEKSIKEIK